MRIEGNEPERSRRSERTDPTDRTERAKEAGRVEESLEQAPTRYPPDDRSDPDDIALVAIVRAELEKILHEPDPDEEPLDERCRRAEALTDEEVARAFLKRMYEDWLEDQDFEEWQREQGYLES